MAEPKAQPTPQVHVVVRIDVPVLYDSEVVALRRALLETVKAYAGAEVEVIVYKVR